MQFLKYFCFLNFWVELIDKTKIHSPFKKKNSIFFFCHFNACPKFFKLFYCCFHLEEFRKFLEELFLGHEFTILRMDVGELTIEEIFDFIDEFIGCYETFIVNQSAELYCHEIIFIEVIFGQVNCLFVNLEVLLIKLFVGFRS